MTKTYKELQVIAKQYGIKANQKAEDLARAIQDHEEQNQKSTIQPVTAQSVGNVMNQVQDQQTKNQKVETTMTTQSNNDFATMFGAFLPKPASNTYEMQKEATGRVYNDSDYEVSPALMKFATDLYIRHNLDVQVLQTMPWQLVKEEVTRLRALPNPVTIKQRELIKKICAELTQVGVPRFAPDEFINTLSFEDASQFIKDLYETQQDNIHLYPPTEKQLELMVGWFLCPDVPFESFGVSKKVMRTDVSPTAWRMMTPGEFEQELATKINRPSASQLIDQYQGIVFEWRKTRCTESQRNYIRNLEDRMANLTKPKEERWAIDQNGNYVKQAVKAKREYNPNGYVPMEELQLHMMSYDEASKMIDQLKSELAQDRKSTIWNDNSQQRLQEKVQKFDERTGVGRAHDDVTGKSKELRVLTDLIFGLEAVVGHNNDELHESVTELLVSHTGNPADVGMQIKEFMEFALATKSITYGGLSSMVEGSSIATQILAMIPQQQA